MKVETVPFSLGNASPAEYEKRYFERENLSKNETEVKLCA